MQCEDLIRNAQAGALGGSFFVGLGGMVFEACGYRTLFVGGARSAEGAFEGCV